MVTTRKTRSKATTTARPKRVPLSGEGRNIMAIEGQDPNFVYRWVNDREGRIDRFKLAGWEMVHSTTSGDRTVDSAEDVDSMVTKKVGGNITAYAMRIKREWWEEDQSSKHKLIEESEEALFRNLDKEQEAALTGKVTFERK